MSDPEKESRVGSQIGPYQLRRLLGKGGMGEVYEAEDTVKDRIVALKLLPESASHDPVFRKRLQREAHAAGRLQEPHVVPIHDYGEVDGVAVRRHAHDRRHRPAQGVEELRADDARASGRRS